MAAYGNTEPPLPAHSSAIANRKLPSFNQFVSSLEHINAPGPQHPLEHQSSTFTLPPRLASPLIHTPQPPYERRRGSFSHILNPISTEQNHTTAPSISPVHSTPSWRPAPIPRDAYEIRQGLTYGMKPLQPRGEISSIAPAKDLPVRSSSLEQDLTLAGKPRKRSAQACQRCREMKIKCRVLGTGCITCLRQGLECTFEAAKTGLRNRRGKRNSEASRDGDQTSTGDATNSPPAKRLCATAGQAIGISKETSPAMSFRLRTSMPTLANVVGNTASNSLDQQRLDRERNHASSQQHHRSISVTSFPPTPPAEHDVEGYETSLRRISTSSSSSRNVGRVEQSGSSGSSTVTASSPPSPLAVDEDPFATAPTLAIAALRHFYTSNIHKQATAASLNDCYGGGESVIPSLESVIVWHDKPSNERMLLYAMLAAGASAASGAAPNDRQGMEMERYSARCRNAAETCLATAGYMFDNLVVQTQMILRAVKFGNGRTNFGLVV